MLGARGPGSTVDERIRLIRSGRHDAARAMIFEGAADQVNAIRDQRGSQGIAGEARKGAAIEGESETPRAIDAAAARRCEKRRSSQSLGSRFTGFVAA